MGLIYQSVPINSLSLLSPEQRVGYVDRLSGLPKSIRQIIFNPRTGAYIRGLMKVHDLAPEQAPKLALVILEIFLGYKELSKFGGILSSQLQMPNDRAQQMAQDVEKELFVPVMMELNTFLSNQKKQLTPSANLGANVLNLKEPPVPPKLGSSQGT